MEYIIRSDESLVNYQGLLNAFPNNFIPAAPTAGYLNDLGVDLVMETFPPEAPTENQKAVRNGVTKVGDLYHQVWKIVDMGEQELAERNPVPATVTRRQALQALLLNGLLDQVPIKLAAIPDPIQRGMAQIEWEASQVFERSRPLVNSIGVALGLTEQGLDDIFRQADKL